MKGFIIEIDAKTALNFIMPRHYAGRKPQITKAFGWYDCETYTDEHLQAVCTFGKPASPHLCIGICGKEWSNSVYELNRLIRRDEWEQPLSSFVSACLRRLRSHDWIVVSYSDTGMHHNGYIYQACNFLYTGQTKQRTDKYTEGNKHSRHYTNENQGKYRKIRTAKNRYVYFCTFKSSLKRQWKECLNYPVLPYPKAENKNYVLGEYQQPVLVLVENKKG